MEAMNRTESVKPMSWGRAAWLILVAIAYFCAVGYLTGCAFQPAGHEGIAPRREVLPQRREGFGFLFRRGWQGGLLVSNKPSTASDGGAAFPRHPGLSIDDAGWSGMTLRDYFAAHCPSDICNTEHRTAAGAFVGRPFPDEGTIEEQAAWNVEVEAKMRYLYADAMLKARGQ